MENENIKSKNKKIKVILWSILVFVLLAVVISGYFLFRYLNPTGKEMFVLANLNTFKAAQQKEEPVAFTKNTNISFETEGDFTNTDAAKAFATFGISLQNEKVSEDSRAYNVSIDFLGNRFFNSEAVKIGNTDVFTVPQLADGSYASDSYSDVLSLLVGSEKPQQTGYLDGVDKEGFKKHFGKYLKRFYENVTDENVDFTKTDDGYYYSVTDFLNRILYEILVDIREDKELRDFYYEQKNIVYNNVNKKIPYAGTLLTIEDKDEYDDKFAEDIEKLIEDIEDSLITISANISKDRKIINEIIEVKNDEGTQLYIKYSEENIVIINNDDGKTKLDLCIDTKTENGITYKNLSTTFDINDLTKEKSEEQKLLTIKSESVTDSTKVAEISFPEKYTDIRNITEDEKKEITQTASKKFMEMVALLMLELI